MRYKRQYSRISDKTFHLSRRLLFKEISDHEIDPISDSQQSNFFVFLKTW